jgi:cell division protein FtsB
VVREKLRELLEAEEDERLRIWARIRLGGERGVDVGRELGQRNGSGVGHLVKRLERTSERNKDLKAKMEQLRNEISKLSRSES